MRFHTDTLTHDDIYAAARVAQVSVETSSRHGSRSRDHAFEISLRGNSRRRPNFYNGDGQYAATWDQWGVFIAFLFKCDSSLLSRTDKNADAFHERTQGRFDLDWSLPVPFPLNHDHTFKFAGVPRSQTCTKCNATQTWGH